MRFNSISVKNVIPLTLFFFLFFSNQAFSQQSLVPVNHTVYEWLYNQRILGNVSNYSYESIPLSRKEIADLLESIDDENIEYGNKRLKETYLNEFSTERISILKEKGYSLQRKTGTFRESLNQKLDYVFDNGEYHFYQHIDSTKNVFVDYLRTDAVILNGNRDDFLKGYYNLKGFRAYGTLYDKVGFHLVYQNFTISLGDNVMPFQPVLGNTWSVAKQGKSSGFYAQGFLSYNFNDNIRVDVGRGSLKYGTGIDETLILSQQAPDFDWIRLTWKSKYLKYTMLHGSLQSLITEDQTLTIGGSNYRSRVTPSRWIVLKKIELTPKNWISLQYTQTTIYSNRNTDLSYFNPIIPIEVAELNNQDRDNPFLNLDVIVRPVKGLEMFAGVGLDDINKYSDIIKKTGKRSSEDGVFSYITGLSYAYKTGTSLHLEYLRIDPFYYSHWQRFNTYENFNQPLGHNLGPNSEQYFVKLRQWFPLRTFIEIGFKRIQQGENFRNDDGTLTDVGGNIFNPQRGGDLVRFLAGDLQAYNQLEISSQVEFLRRFKIQINYVNRMVQKGLLLDDNQYLEFAISLGI